MNIQRQSHLVKKPLKLEQKIFDKDHYFLVNFYNTVGLAYSHLKQYLKALSYCQKSLDICEKTPDQNSLDLAKLIY